MARRKPEPVEDDITIESLDEAFAHLSAVPQDERGAAWHAYADELLSKRLALTGAE